MDVFDPTHLTPRASLNRVRIVDLPGVVLEPEIQGKTAFDLLGAASIAHRVRVHASELQISATQERTALDLLPALPAQIPDWTPTETSELDERSTFVQQKKTGSTS